MIYFFIAGILLIVLYIIFGNDSKRDQRREQLLKQENKKQSLEFFEENINNKINELETWKSSIETKYSTNEPTQLDFHFNGLPYNFNEDCYTAFDFETANDDVNSVIKLSIAHFIGNKLIEIKEYLFNPGKQYTIEGDNFKYTNLHGIRPSEVLSQPTIFEKWPEIQPELNGKHLIAHRMDFDVNILRNIISQSSLKLSNCKFTCTHYYSKLSMKWMRTFKLTDVCTDANIPIWDNPSKFKAVSTGLLFMYLTTIVSRTSYNRFITGININLKKTN